VDGTQGKVPTGGYEMMCNCIKSAIEHGYVIRGSTYDDVTKDFKDLDIYSIPVTIKDDKGKNKNVRLMVHCCFVCGEKLPQEAGK
jgi:hypothetical protein